MKKVLFFPIFLALLVVVILFFLSNETKLRLEPPVRVIGKNTPVRLAIENPHGVRRLSAALEQGGSRYPVFEQSQTADRLWFWRKAEAPRSFDLTVGTSQAPKLRDGKARLVIEAQSNDLRGRVDTIAFDVEVNTKPPVLTVDNAQHYINQGGSELVTFSVSGYWTEAGVRVGSYTFRSFPLPGSGSQRLSLFAYPWDVPPGTTPVVYARNPAGEEVTATFWHRVFPKRFRQRNLTLDEPLMRTLVNNVNPSGQGQVVDRFLLINGEMRRENNRILSELRHRTAERFLWSGPFLQLSNSKVESEFADTRDYIYEGRKIDRQTHLGFDLSVTRKVPVVAANDGKVIFSESLGIYGNCVVIDHGYGLQSIYAHLSEIGVKPGEAVRKGQAIGNSGSTGLAAGDHLHFSMQVDGVQVNPIEWWDGHWIQDRIRSKLPESGPASPATAAN